MFCLIPLIWVKTNGKQSVNGINNTWKIDPAASCMTSNISRFQTCGMVRNAINVTNHFKHLMNFQTKQGKRISIVVKIIKLRCVFNKNDNKEIIDMHMGNWIENIEHVLIFLLPNYFKTHFNASIQLVFDCLNFTLKAHTWRLD